MNAYDAAFPPGRSVRFGSVRLKLVDLVRPKGQAARSYFSLVFFQTARKSAKQSLPDVGKCRQTALAVVNSPAIQSFQ